MDTKTVASIVERYQAKTTAPLGVAYCDLSTGEEYFHLGDQLFPLASMFKVFLLVELFRRRDRGEVDLSERIPFMQADQVTGSGILRNLEPGFSLTLADYCYLMMAYSDNSATDVVGRYATLEQVHDDILVPFGFTSTRVDICCRELLRLAYIDRAENGEMVNPTRPSYRNTPFFRCEAEKNQQSTPREFLRLFRMIYEGEFASPETSREILDVMARCETNRRIPLLLPKLRIAHKTGTLDRLCNDAGIVSTPKGDYALALFYNGNLAARDEYMANTKSRTGEALLSELSLDLYRAYLG